MSTVRVSAREAISIMSIPASTDDLAGVQSADVEQIDILWPNGTSANQANTFAHDSDRSLATGANETLDLSAFAGGPNGSTVNIAEVRGLLITCDPDNTTTLTFEPGASNGWTGLGAAWKFTLGPGDKFRLWSPADGNHPVSGTSKTIKVTNSAGATAHYSITPIGTLT